MLRICEVFAKFASKRWFLKWRRGMLVATQGGIPMKEVKTPKKPLAIYYAIVLLVLMLLNFVLVPWMSERQVKEVDYGTFMSMTEDKDIGRVDVESNQIIFTDKDEIGRASCRERV